MRLTPKTITRPERSIRFIVPLYQRLFAWPEDKVSGLLYDLLLHFDKYADPKTSDPHYPYYMGVITTIIQDGKYCLVDGQQRLTVLMIMASVFSRISTQWKLFFDNGKRIELFAREDDTLFLKNLADGHTQGIYVNVLMANAYKEIVDFLTKLDDRRQKQFVDSCFTRITLFNSILPDNYLSDPPSLNRYFEVMNSAGVNLEQHEILKVSLLSGQKDQTKLLRIWNTCSDFSLPLLKKKESTGLKEYSDRYARLFSLSTEDALDFISEYNNQKTDPADIAGQYPTIAEIEIEAQEFTNHVSGNNERSVLTFSEFLLLALDIYKNLDGEWTFHKADQLTDRFNENLLPHEVPGFYDLLLRLRIALDMYVIRRKFDGSDSHYELIYREDEIRKTENICLEQFEAMLDVSTPYYKWLKELLVYLIDTDRSPASGDILSMLKSRDNTRNPAPQSGANFTYANVDRYWFWRLDYYLWEQTVLSDKPQPYRQAIIDYTFRTNRSIEHLHPQNEANNYIWNREDIDSFGNLAMISQSFNSQQSNESVLVKFSRIKAQASNRRLQSIKLLKMFLSADENPDGWTSDAAKAHETEMMKILRDSYLC